MENVLAKVERYRNLHSLCYCNKHEWERYQSVVDTHHLRLRVIHDRQQVLSSFSFCAAAEINRIAWPGFETEKDSSDQMWFKNKKPCSEEAGVIGAGGGVNNALRSASLVTAHGNSNIFDCLTEWPTPPNLDEWKARPVRKAPKVGFLSCFSVRLPTYFTRKSHPLLFSCRLHVLSPGNTTSTEI